MLDQKPSRSQLRPVLTTNQIGSVYTHCRVLGFPSLLHGRQVTHLGNRMGARHLRRLHLVLFDICWCHRKRMASRDSIMQFRAALNVSRWCHRISRVPFQLRSPHALVVQHSWSSRQYHNGENTDVSARCTGHAAVIRNAVPLQQGSTVGHCFGTKVSIREPHIHRTDDRVLWIIAGRSCKTCTFDSKQLRPAVQQNTDI